MKKIIAVCATVAGVALLSGGTALSDDRCPPGHAAAGLCAPLHFIDHDSSRSELLRRRAYERGYRDALHRHQESAPPPDVALDGKEGYSQSYDVHRRYLDRDGRRYDRRYDNRDEYYERRLRRNNAGDVVTDVLRGLLN